jgi:predicted tellurium resistance membrane protein TerC
VAEAKSKTIWFGLSLGKSGFLLSIAFWLIKLKKPLFFVWEHAFSIHDLFLILGGLFLLTKATREIQKDFHIHHPPPPKKTTMAHLVSVVSQIALFDMIFSLDSVLTAVGLSRHLWVMIFAITVSILVMLFVGKPLGKLIDQHPTLKMLALSFLMLIGTLLLADGLGFHVPRGYLYFAMGFSLFVEIMNILRSRALKKKSQPS